MHIRSPKSGFLRVHFTRPAVAQGELLFSFNPHEEEIEVMKAELALSLIRSSIEKLQAAKEKGNIKPMLDAFKHRADQCEVAYDQLLQTRHSRLLLGLENPDTVDQAVALKSLAQRDQALAHVSHDRMLTSLNDLEHVLPLQEDYSKLALDITKASVARLRILSPVTGTLSAWQASDGWTSQGAVIASFES